MKQAEILTDEVRIILEREKEGAVKYIYVFRLHQSSWNICNQTMALLISECDTESSLSVFFASDIIVWPAIHDFMYINPCLSQANGLVTKLHY